MSGIVLVATERQRQQEVEGWTPEHDDMHQSAELTRAGMSYADSARRQLLGASEEFGLRLPWAALWPFEESWWKPSTDPIRNVVKAAALLVAEIDRLLRARGETVFPTQEPKKLEEALELLALARQHEQNQFLEIQRQRQTITELEAKLEAARVAEED